MSEGPRPVSEGGPVSEAPRLIEGPRLVEGPRLISRADFMAQQSPAQTGATNDATPGLQR